MTIKATPTISPDWLTRKQAATILQVNPRTVDRWVKDGILVARRPAPKSIRISAASIDKILPGSCA